MRLFRKIRWLIGGVVFFLVPSYLTIKKVQMGVLKTSEEGKKKVNWLGLAIEIVKVAIAFFTGTQV